MSTLSDVQALYGSVQVTWTKSRAHVVSHVVFAGVVFGICGATLPKMTPLSIDPKQISDNDWFKLAKDIGIVYAAFVVPLVLLTAYAELLRVMGQFFAAIVMIILPPSPYTNQYRLVTPSALEPLALTLDSNDFELYDLRRKAELKEVLKYYPAVKIIQPELRDVIPNTVQDAVTQVTAVLAKYPDKGSIKAIWSAWDIPQLGATQALIAAGRTEVKTYGVDGTPEVVELVKDPKSPAAAVAAQQPSLIGKTAVQNVARYFAGDKTLPQATYISSLLVTKENAAEAQKALGQI